MLAEDHITQKATSKLPKYHGAKGLNLWGKRVKSSSIWTQTMPNLLTECDKGHPPRGQIFQSVRMNLKRPTVTRLCSNPNIATEDTSLGLKTEAICFVTL